MVKKLSLFLVATFVWSWGFWGWMILNGQIAGYRTSYSHLPGLLGPLFGALVVSLVCDGPEGLGRYLKALIRLPKYPLRSLGLVMVPALIALIVTSQFGYRPSLSRVLIYPGIPTGLSPLTSVLIVYILNGLGEEAGWRGYLLPELARRFGTMTAIWIIVIIWLVWHAPLFWINASMIHMGPPMILGWAIGLMCGAFVLTHVYVLSGQSVLVVALWHVVYNYSVATPAVTGIIAMYVSMAIMVWGLLLAIWWTIGQPPRIART